jgi:hypothetical protein
LFWYRKFLALARQHQIKVFLFNAPMPPSFQQAAEEDVRAYRGVLSELSGQFDNVTLIEPLLSIYEWEDFYDFSHLNRNGSCRFSQELGHDLVNHLRGHDDPLGARRSASPGPR